ncbi:MAG: hypothetical protein CSB34_02500 [Desulfobulbus propionicus]|nr:MAG: hypothetical protein CSB34_02500 [Desulfobulbus propionicus]
MSDSIQPINAIKPIEECQESGDVSNDPAKMDYIAGRKFYAEGDYPQAVISFHNALLGFEEKNDVQGIANASDRLGDTCLAREEYELAVKHFKRAAAICEQEDDSFSLASLNKKMALAYRQLGESENAFELLFDLLEHYRLINNPKGVVEILQAVAELYEEVGEKEKAADTYRTISGIHKNFKHKQLAKEFADKAEKLQ